MPVVINGTTGVSGVDGSASTPSYQGTDTNTGIFYPAADTIAFAEGGTEVMRIDSSGNVSIGATSSSSQAFRVSQTAFPNVPSGWYANAGDGNAEQYGITRVDATNGRGIRFQTTLDGSNLPYYSISTGTAASTIAGMTWTERMRIDSSGNVGIGTSSPGQKLDVRGSGNTYLRIEDTQANGYNAATLYKNDQRQFRVGVLGTAGGFTNGALVVYDETAADWRMVIDSSGNFQFNSGYGSVATAYGCRAWVNFNGTGTVAIRASGNVTSITDNGTGDYTVNFTTAMPNANYSMIGTSSLPAGGSDRRVVATNLNTTPTTSAVRISVGYGATADDQTYVQVAIFR